MIKRLLFSSKLYVKYSIAATIRYFLFFRKRPLGAVKTAGNKQKICGLNKRETGLPHGFQDCGALNPLHCP
jgi:hypothetical protein